MLQRKKQQEAEEQHSQWCTSTVSCHQLLDPIATDIQNFAFPIIDNDIIFNPIKGFTLLLYYNYCYQIYQVFYHIILINGGNIEY